MRNICDLEYKQNLFIDLHLPDNDNFDLLVYFHGGGLVSGTRKDADVFVETLAKNNIATASVEYSLYPNAKFPDFITDCAQAVKWLKENICRYGKCNRLFVGGSSAGGYISMMLCFDEKYLKEVGVLATDIAGYIHDAGQPTTHFNVLKEFGMDGKRIVVDETAPLYYVGLSERYAPMVFIISDNDMFGRHEQTMLILKTLEHFGHKDKVFLEILSGKHYEYVGKQDENKESVFGNVISKYIKKMNVI